MKLRRSKKSGEKGLKIMEHLSPPPLMSSSPWKQPFILNMLCKDCGQSHQKQKPHLYDYSETVDEFTCKICYQPLVDPVDTKCGHTFCEKCILNKFKEKWARCPLDSTSLTLEDIKPCNWIIRQLLDKLLVVCPNVDYCEEVLPRCELQAHLQYRCKGAVIKCLRASEGCTFQGPRSALQSHLWDCSYRDVSTGVESEEWVPVSDGRVSTIHINRGCYDLGVNIVGGIDTPLMCIVIQEVNSEGIASKDGRLQAGDQLLEVNGIDLTNATHTEAREAITQPYPICHLTVYREKSETNSSPHKEEVIDISLPKLPGKQLGIKLMNKKTGPGLYILELIPGSLAFLDNRLKKEDRILQINSEDMTYGSQEQASKCIQTSREKVHFRVSRHVVAQSLSPDITHDSPSKESLLNFSVYSKESLFSYYPFKQCQEKQVNITKSSEETLGISVAGGIRNVRGDSPIYVSNIHPSGSLGRSKQIKKGDVLLSINGQSLLDLTHSEAVNLLKSWISETTVSMRVLEGVESSDGLHDFIPSWKYWLCLPEPCHIVKTIHLERSVSGSLGFSIVGGCDSGSGLVPIYVKAVVPGTPAAQDGKLKSGDMLLGVNGQCLENVTHTQAVTLLKGAKGNKVYLRLVSWPGTHV